MNTFDLLVQLCASQKRQDVSRTLAARLGVEDFLVFVRDPALQTLIPAGGFAQTYRGGPAWRAFLLQCKTDGEHLGEVDMPAGVMRPAVGKVHSGIAVLLVGGSPIGEELKVVYQLFPMLAAILLAEQHAEFAAVEAREAQIAAGRAQALSEALELARAEGWKLNLELREEHRRKDDFLAMLAHELRNPLSPLVTSIELLRGHALDKAATERQLDIMGRQVNQLTRLVEDLLDVSRVSRGRIELRRQPMTLASVLSDAVEATAPLMKTRRHVLDVVMSDEALAVNADTARLTQVFSNLLNNAAKYTDPGGHLRLSLCRESTDAVVRVSDNGVGISAEMLPRIFDLFAQAPVALARSQGGLGIGLTLVKELVALHDGQVGAVSEGVGKGSTFTVWLPLSDARLAPVREAPQQNLSSHADDALNILVVDDNRDAADGLAEVLRQMGHHVEVAYGGFKALQIASDLHPNLVFLDLGLPEIDGYEVGRRLRRISSSAARLVALTGYGSEEDKRQTREAGFDEHTVKPVTAEALRGLLSRAVSVGQ